MTNASPLHFCNNKPRPVAGATVTGSQWYGSQTWTFANSTDCKYDFRASDPACSGCPWREEK